MQVVDAPGASVVAPQAGAGTRESSMATLVRVTAPVLVTRNENGMVSPASTRPLPLTSAGSPADLSRVMVAMVEVGVVVVSDGDVTAGPLGGVPEAVAVLMTLPLSTSAWLIGYVAVQVTPAPGASVVVEHVTGPTFTSSTVTPVSVWAPVLATRNE